MPTPANIRIVEPPHGLASLGPISEDELSWANRLVLCDNLGGHIVGRDDHGHLVAATTLRAGRDVPCTERYSTTTPKRQSERERWVRREGALSTGAGGISSGQLD